MISVISIVILKTFSAVLFIVPATIFGIISYILEKRIKKPDADYRKKS